MNTAAPGIKNNFVCIADRHSPELAAMVCSYLAEENYFLPLFEIQGVTAPKTHAISDPPDEHTFSQTRAEEVTNAIRNAIVRLKGCGDIILIGLSEDQKSYLQLPEVLDPITINTADEVHIKLSPLFPEQKPFLSCQPHEILKGLQQAVQTGHWLKVSTAAAPLHIAIKSNGNCIVIEDEPSTMAVMAVNYALSVNAEVIVVPRPGEDEVKNILRYLAAWKGRDRDATARGLDLRGRKHKVLARNKLRDAINHRIAAVDFSGYEFVTFFTAGIPYSLIVGDVACCTYVHMNYGPDHFTFNNILYANHPGTGGALLFSPLSLNSPALDSAQSEIDGVSGELAGINFHVQYLLGKQATVYHFSRYLQHYPYDLLHICSHGGEIPGTRLRSEFVDNAGVTHSVIYDRVLSFAVMPHKRNGEPLIEVHCMIFPRSYNELEIGSDELEAQQYPHEFFVECQNAIFNKRTISDTLIGEVEGVPASSSVNCSDYPFQGMIHYLAAGMKPVIFNNTCWSWGPVAASFLKKGARGYIGTLWEVNDWPAAATAAYFYKHIKTMSVAKAIFTAAKQHQPAEDKNIYVFYGFPFTILHPGTTEQESRRLVRLQLARTRESFRRSRTTATNSKVQETLDFIIGWHDEMLSS